MYYVVENVTSIKWHILNPAACLLIFSMFVINFRKYCIILSVLRINWQFPNHPFIYIDPCPVRPSIPDYFCRNNLFIEQLRIEL